MELARHQALVAGFLTSTAPPRPSWLKSQLAVESWPASRRPVKKLPRLSGCLHGVGTPRGRSRPLVATAVSTTLATVASCAISQYDSPFRHDGEHSSLNLAI